MRKMNLGFVALMTPICLYCVIEANFADPAEGFYANRPFHPGFFLWLNLLGLRSKIINDSEPAEKDSLYP